MQCCEAAGTGSVAGAGRIAIGTRSQAVARITSQLPQHTISVISYW